MTGPDDRAPPDCLRTKAAKSCLASGCEYHNVDNDAQSDCNYTVHSIARSTCIIAILNRMVPDKLVLSYVYIASSL